MSPLPVFQPGEILEAAQLNQIVTVLDDIEVPTMWTGTVSLTNLFTEHFFPPGLFTNTPNVFLQVLSASGGSLGAVAMVAERSATSFRARKVNGTNDTIAFMYFAIETA